MAEPSSLLRRLTALERRVAELEDKERTSSALAWNARHQGIFHDLVMDEVILPTLLMLGGQERKTWLLNALQAVIESIPEMPGIPPQVAPYYAADVRGWQNAVQAIPEWQPLHADGRHPGYDDDHDI